MNKQFTIIAFLLAILIFSSEINAQISFQVGGGLGYTIPSADYSGTTIDFYNGTKYGLESGINFHAKARLNLLLISAFGEIGYSSLSGNGESEPGQGSVDISHKIVSIKLGPEFHLGVPMTPLTAYLQVFGAYNTISGTVEFQGVSNVPSGSYDLASASRIGAGAGVGVIYSFSGFDLDFNIQYHLVNLGGKEYKIENITSHERLDNYTSLNDGKDPLYNINSTGHFIKNDRALDTVELKLSILFGL